MEINGSEIVYGRSNGIDIDGQSKLDVAGSKFEQRDDLVNAHKTVQLRIGFQEKP